MPLLYKNNKPNMKSVTELDQSEAIFIIATQPMYSFTQEQANRMVQIVRDYYNPNQSGCASCGSGMRTAKDSIIAPSSLLMYFSQISLSLTEMILPRTRFPFRVSLFFCRYERNSSISVW